VFGFLGVKMTCNGEKKRKREKIRRLATEGKL
jgi:hypothetical protein